MRQTLVSYLDDFVARGGETAFVHRCGLRTVRRSYGQIAVAAFQFARELEARHIGKGDRVLLWAENSSEWVAAFFGCLLRGIIIVPLDAESAPDFVLRVQQQVKAKLLLRTGAGQCDLNLPLLRLDELSETLTAHSSAPYPARDVTESDIVEIIFTSGTTAEPKGVVLTHRNLLANLSPLEQEIQKYLKWERLVHPLRFLSLLPLSHVFGQLMGIFIPQLLGGEVFFQESLNPSEIMETTRRQRISVVVLVPRVLDTLRDKIERDWAAQGLARAFQKKLASLQNRHFIRRWWAFRQIHRWFGWKFWAFVSGGATLNAETENFWKQLGFVVVQGYGMTETASLVSVNHPFKMSGRSIGKALPGQEVKLDANGEILVRGANVSLGYWNEGLGRTATDEEGWLRTGDVAEVDREGNLYFKGRKKDVIVTAAGLNIYPDDLEAALNRQPEVRDSAVIEWEGQHGPEPLAVLILRDERSNPTEAVGRANRTLGQHQQIRHWFVWPESDFPRTPTQKVRKRTLAEAVKARLITNQPERRNRPATLADTIARISGNMPARLDASTNLTTDLKLDSLGRVELLSALEDRYQVELDEAAFTAASTVGDIERMVQENAPQKSAAPYPYPEWPQRFPTTWLRFIIYYLLVLPPVCLMGWPRVRGRRYLRELKGPLLFVSNHVTMMDHALILAALPRRFRHHLAIAMEGERLRDWLYPPDGTGLFTRLRWLAQYVLVTLFFNVFPLPKKSGFRHSFAFAGKAMDRGYSVLVFPEGKRTEDGRMNPFMTGTGLLATKLNAPVVPVRIDGLFELKKRGKHFARPGQVSVTFDAPVSFAHAEDPASVARELERRVDSL